VRQGDIKSGKAPSADRVSLYSALWMRQDFAPAMAALLSPTNATANPSHHHVPLLILMS
jgi:hypothetical protein